MNALERRLSTTKPAARTISGGAFQSMSDPGMNRRARHHEHTRSQIPALLLRFSRLIAALEMIGRRPGGQAAPQSQLRRNLNVKRAHALAK